MNPEVQVQKALKSLADYDRGQQAHMPAHAIFKHHRPVPRWKMGAALSAVTLAAAAALILFLRPAPAPIKQQQPTVVSAMPTTVPEEIAAAAPALTPASRAKRLAAPAPHEVVTDFFPLMDAPPPFERGQLLRVMVPASTMRSVGLPISPERWSERVQADVLVGEEGMARAIRFVSYER